VSVRRLAYRLYEGRLRRGLRGAPLPRHIGLIIDGNRRWAKAAGLASPSDGHRQGAEHIWAALSWCQAAGIRHVTVFICSAENLSKRDDTEVAALMEIIEQVVLTRLAAANSGWQVHVAGLVDMLPDSTARALQEIVEAVRAFLEERAGTGATLADLAAGLRPDDIARHLAGAGQPEPDLIIRTSGEQRMSNFLLWQSTDAYLHFCDCYWPAFREVDFLRALRDFAARQRRPS
jgi:short-chain Z-isoprenyl diphosphate synthase